MTSPSTGLPGTTGAAGQAGWDCIFFRGTWRGGRVVRQRSLVSAGAEGLRRRLAGSMDRCKTHSGEAIAGKIYRWNEMAHASRRIS